MFSLAQKALAPSDHHNCRITTDDAPQTRKGIFDLDEILPTTKKKSTSISNDLQLDAVLIERRVAYHILNIDGFLQIYSTGIWTQIIHIFHTHNLNNSIHYTAPHAHNFIRIIPIWLTKHSSFGARGLLESSRSELGRNQISLTSKRGFWRCFHHGSL
ncbi:hypothetical protein RCL_jg29396.t1 [Rhizophagus clarus]|uniref:Uncharacterized protein n=1 Tax=Rhizophagus clarus TaxID=94130 RepID=A0A8H3QIF6_9GLOM|nr:hypothetical protein RCL_jg29396.t1 [Rhizophagus clarus]